MPGLNSFSSGKKLLHKDTLNVFLFGNHFKTRTFKRFQSYRTEHRVDFYDRLELLEQYAYMQHELANKSPIYFFENGTLRVGVVTKESLSH